MRPTRFNKQHSDLTVGFRSLAPRLNQSTKDLRAPRVTHKKIVPQHPEESQRLSNSAKMRASHRQMKTMLLNYKYGSIVPEAVPSFDTMNTYLQKGKLFERDTIVKVFGGITRSVQQQMQQYCYGLIDKLNSQTNCQGFQEFKGTIKEFTKRCKQSYSEIEAYCLKYPARGKVSWLSKISKSLEKGYLLADIVRRCLRIYSKLVECTSLPTLLSFTGYALGRSFNQEVSMGHVLGTEMMDLLQKSLKYWQRGIVHSRSIQHYSHMVCECLSAIKSLRNTHSDPLKTLKDLQSIKKCGQLVQRFLQQNEMRPQTPESAQLERICGVAKSELANTAEIVDQSITYAQNRLLPIIRLSLQLKESSLPTSLEQFIDLLGMAQSLATQTSQCDCWIIPQNMEATKQKIELSVEYKQTALLLLSSIEQRLGRVLIVDEPSEQLNKLVGDSQSLYQLSMGYVSKLSSGMSCSSFGRKQRKLLVNLLNCSERLIRLKQNKIGSCLFVPDGKQDRLSEFDWLQQPLLQNTLRYLQLIKRVVNDIDDISTQLSQVLTVGYGHPFLADIHTLGSLFQKYVSITHFSSTLLLQLVEDANRLESDPAWARLCGGLAHALIHKVKFKGIPQDIYRMSKEEYQDFVKALPENSDVRSEISRTVQMLATMSGTTVKQCLVTLTERVSSYEDALTIHVKLNQLNQIQASTKDGSFTERLRHNMDALIADLFLRNDRQAAHASLAKVCSLYESVQEELVAYRQDLPCWWKQCPLLTQPYGCVSSMVDTIIGTLRNTQIAFVSEGSQLQAVEQYRQLQTLLMGEAEWHAVASSWLAALFYQYCSDKLRGMSANIRVPTSIKPQTPLTETTKHQMLQAVLDLEQASNAIAAIDHHFVERISVQSANMLFGVRVVNEPLSATASGAVSSVQKLVPMLSSCSGLEHLLLFLRKIEVAALFQTPALQRCELVQSIVSDMNTPATSWWTLQAANYPGTVLCYTLHQSTMKQTISTIIAYSYGDSTDPNVDTVLQSMTVSAGQAYQIVSTSQLEYHTNSTLEAYINQKHSANEQVIRCFQQAYRQLWQFVLLQDNSSILRTAGQRLVNAIRLLCSDCFKAADAVLTQNFVISHKPALNKKCTELLGTMEHLEGLFIPTRSMGLKDLDQFSRVANSICCLDISTFKQFVDYESGSVCAIYDSDQALVELIESTILLLFRPEKSEDMRMNANQLKWWRSIAQLIPQQPLDTVLAKLRSQYSGLVIAKMLQQRFKLKTYALAFLQHLNRGDITECSIEQPNIRAFEQLLATLQSLCRSIRPEALSHYWLRDIHGCVQSTCGWLAELLGWIQDTSSIAHRELETTPQVLGEFASKMRRVIELFGIEDQVLILVDSDKAQIGAFYLQNSENRLAEAKLIFRRLYSHQRGQFFDEVLNQAMTVQSPTDVRVGKFRFLLDPSSNCPISSNYQFRVFYKKDELTSWATFGPIEIEVPIDRLSQLAVEIRSGSEQRRYTHMTIEGTVIRFPGIQQQLEEQQLQLEAEQANNTPITTADCSGITKKDEKQDQ